MRGSTVSVLIQRDVYLISPQDKHSRLVRRELREEAIAKLERGQFVLRDDETLA